jgi:hypothetical protein
MINDIEYSELYFDEYNELYNSNCNKFLFYPTANKIIEDNICSICLDSLEFQEEFQIENLCRLSCDHHFHKNCIKPWIIKNDIPTCPKCRSTCKCKTIIVVNKSFLIKAWEEKISEFTKQK